MPSFDNGNGGLPPTSGGGKGDECPICGGTGFVIADVLPGHSDFGKAIPCVCRQEERRERRLKALSEMGGRDGISRLTFESFEPNGNGLPPARADNLRRAYETAKAFAATPEGWLLISGTYGCGKTHLAAAIANYSFENGSPAVFMVVPDLFDHLRATYSPASDTSFDSLYQQLSNTPLLILDDLGSQSSTPWVQEKLYQLINYRYARRLPTVITTNQRLEDMEPRIRSRIQDFAFVHRVQITAPDFRVGSSYVHPEMSSLDSHRSQRFDNFDVRRSDVPEVERASLKAVLQTSIDFAEKPFGWLVILGDNGSGKTHLAAAIANEQVEKARVDVMFVQVPDLLDYLRASFSPQSPTTLDQRFDQIKRVPVLVLDDLGTESATPWAKEKLFQLLSFRFDRSLPTVITSSIPLDKIDPWLQTRMYDYEKCQQVSILARSYSGSATQRAANRNRKR